MFVESPLFTAHVDRVRATVHARGRLDHISADLLRGTVEALWRQGQRDITLDVGGLNAPDASAGAVLTTLMADLAATGIRLTLHGRRFTPSSRTSVAEAPQAEGCPS